MPAKKVLKKHAGSPKQQLSEQAMNGRPREIGIINPYVLYNILKPPIDGMSLKERKVELKDKNTLSVLNTHFRKNKQISKDLTYAQLFDPQFSPLFKPVEGINVHYEKKSKERISAAGKRREVGASGSGSPDHNTSEAKTYGSLAGNPQFILPKAYRSEIFNDIIQGAARDCYFDAALNAVTWVFYPNFPPVETSIGFYKNGTKHMWWQVPTRTFPRDAQQNPVYNQKSGANEYWACAWEKAYAQFKLLKKSDLTDARAIQPPGAAPPFRDYDPELSQFGFGDPLESLVEITNKKYDFTPTRFGHPSAYDLVSCPSTSCYDILAFYNQIGATNTSTMTKYCSVAWTKDVFVPPVDKAVVPKHAYTILGTYLDPITCTKYVVVRNPWGLPFQTGAFGSLAQSGTYCPSTVDLAISLGPSSTMGIFGIENTTFNSYFAGFGWVQ